MPKHPQARPGAPHKPGIHFSEAAGLRHLHVGGSAIQSAMRLDAPDELALAYTRAMMACLLFNPQPRDVLVDDGARHVELNPQSADVILLDAFVNHRQAPSIRTESFYRAARRALRPDGVLVINFMSDDPGLHAYIRRLAKAFAARVFCLRAIGEDNIIAFAFRDDPGVITPASLIGRVIALERELGLEFRAFARRLRPLDRVRVRGRPLLSIKALRSIRASEAGRRGKTATRG